jgi:hypothetical protein
MTSLMVDFVADLSDGERIQILHDHAQFEKTGSIGDCVLRVRAREFRSSIDSDASLVFWMESLSNECYRFYARLYLKEHGF